MSTGQAVGAVAGGAIGFFVGGPTGAMYGAQIGMAAGGYLDPPKGPTQSGPRLSDTSQQTSTYGATIPRVYGTIAVLGNIFWLEHNKLKEVVKKKKSGGKGGGSSTTVKTYTYYGTFAVGLCEGPIAGVRRIWVGPDLVYDAGSDDLETIIASNQASSKFSIYLGTADQQPDPRMQAEMGVANCPAYRGLAYIVVKDLLLTKYGNSIQGAPIKAEVVTQLSESSVNIDYSLLPGYSTGLAYGLNPISGDGYESSAWLVGTAGDISVSPVTLIRKPNGYIYKTLTNHIGVAPVGGFIPMVCKLSASDCVMTINRQFAGHGWCGIWRDDIFASITLPYAHVAKGLIESGDRSYLLSGQYQIEAIYQIDAFSASPALTPIPVAPGWDLLDALFVITDDGFAMIYKGVTPADIEIARYDGASYSFSTIAFTGPTITRLTPSDCSGGIVSLALRYTATTCQILRIDLIAGAIVSDREEPFSFPGTSGSYESMRYVDDLIFMAGVSSGGLFESIAEVDKEISEAVSLADIVRSEIMRSGLISESDINVSELTDDVIGFKISNIGSIRNAIEPLQGAFPFDTIQSGYKIKAVPRGQLPVAAIDVGDIGIEEQLRQVREMDTQLPTKIIANYLDKARNYDANEQFWERLSSGAVNTRTMELPIVMAASQALQVVERLGNLYWLERTEFGPFVLPPTFGNLEAGDVVTMHAGYADYELRLTLVNYQSDGSLACSAKLNNPSLYISQAASQETPDATTIPLAGASLYALLDIPVVDETLQNEPGLVGVMTGYASGWPGGVIYRSPDNGQSWDSLQAFDGKATLGYARGVLGAHPGNLIDYGSTLTVDLLSGGLSAITEAQMLNGANTVAYGANGRWEILRFAGSTLNADSSNTISTLIRGDRGTEWATGLHVAGDLFVLLDDPDGAWISMPTELIGAPRTYRGITSGDDIDSASSDTLTYQGVNLECLSPVHPAGVRDGSSNLAISWKRRTRIGGAWRDNVDAGLGETSEAYEIDILSGTTVKRTLASVTPAATYTAADQTTDFGSAQSSITVRIYQLSSMVGRGYALEAIL